MTKCYQLIGVPGAGKSTWVWSQNWIEDCAYVSTDTWVELEAERPGKEIPDHVVASMIASWEDPTLEEGFEEIWYI